MCVYVVYDTYNTMKDELTTAQTDLLTSELGGAGARYLCTAEQPVDITEKLARKRRHRCAHDRSLVSLTRQDKTADKTVRQVTAVRQHDSSLVSLGLRSSH